MSFSGISAKLCVLFKLDLPSYSIRLSEGGSVFWNGELYTPDDSTFGVPTKFESYKSGSADEAPGFELQLAPPAVTAAAVLSQPSYQKSPAVFAVVSINKETGTILSERTIFRGILDYTNIEGDLRRRLLNVGITTDMDRFFWTDKGNRLSPAFHRSVHGAETGLDLMSGTAIKTPWGDKGPQPKINGYGNTSGRLPGFIPGIGPGNRDFDGLDY